MKNEASYINFPIVLMQNAYKDFSSFMMNALLYASYYHCKTSMSFGEDVDKFGDSLRYFGYQNKSSLEINFFKAEQLYDDIPIVVPMTGVSIQVFKDFCFQPKTKEQIAVFLAFIGLKSIIGRKAYCKITNQYFLARMGGFACIKDVPSPLPPSLQDWNTRRKLERIKAELERSWNVNIYGYKMRGFYISIDNKYSRPKLIEVAESKRKSFSTKMLKKLNNEIRLEVLSRI
jgi:hypothetical protein